MIRLLTQAFRRIRNRPTTALAMAFTLALGIGFNLVVFTVLHCVAFKPLPYPDSTELYVLRINTESGPRSMSSLEYTHLSEMAAQLESIAAYRFGFATIRGGSEAVAITRSSVTPTFWTTLRVNPLLGQVFVGRDLRVAVISHTLWLEQFHGIPDVLGAMIDVDGVSHVISGVMPPGFAFPSRTQVWTPFASELEIKRVNVSGVIGRIRRNTTESAVETELNHLLIQARQSRPDIGAEGRIACISLQDYLVGRAHLLLLAIAGVALCVLLIACTNLAGVLLADGLRRVPEIAVRTALGAGRRRIIIELLTEPLALSAIAGIAAIGLAYALLPVALAHIPTGIVPRLHEVHIDGQVLVFAVGLSLVTSAFTGAIPALYLSRTSPSELVKAGSSRLVAGGASSLSRFLVSVQVGLVLVVLVFTGLMIRTVGNLRSVQPGFRPGDLYAVTVFPRQVQNLEQMKVVCEELLTRIIASPGIQSAAVSNWIPFGNATVSTSVGPEGRPDLFDELVALRMAVSHTYFDTMGIRILNGRALVAADSRFSEAVVINESLAKRVWPGGDPIGKRLTFSAASYSQGPPRVSGQPSGGWLTVVGVAEDVKQSGLQDPAPLTVYQPFSQVADSRLLTQVVYLARSARSGLDPTNTVRQVIKTSTVDQPVYVATPMETLVEGSIAERRLQASLLGVFSILALLVAATGIYGTMASYTSRTRRDIGIRLALGAQQGDIYRASLKQAALLVLPGILIGVAFVPLLSSAIRKFLFGLDPTDPLTLAVCSGCLLLVGGLACFLPVHRALRSDPVHELRSE